MFWKFSFKDISVDHICEIAEVNKGTFYRYFESKVDLCLQVIDNNYAMLIKDILREVFRKLTAQSQGMKESFDGYTIYKRNFMRMKVNVVVVHLLIWQWSFPIKRNLFGKS